MAIAVPIKKFNPRECHVIEEDSQGEVEVSVGEECRWCSSTDGDEEKISQGVTVEVDGMNTRRQIVAEDRALTGELSRGGSGEERNAPRLRERLPDR